MGDSKYFPINKSLVVNLAVIYPPARGNDTVAQLSNSGHHSRIDVASVHTCCVLLCLDTKTIFTAKQSTTREVYSHLKPIMGDDGDGKQSTKHENT